MGWIAPACEVFQPDLMAVSRSCSSVD
jgi:hypothetical protein